MQNMKISRTLMEGVTVYVVAFLAVILTPLVAQPIANLFAFIAYNQMNKFIFELLTALIWIGEIGALASVVNSRRKKREKRAIIRKMLDGGKLDPSIPESVLMEATIEELAAADAGETADSVMDSERESDGEKKKKPLGKKGEFKFRGEILPFKNLAILSLLAVACIFAISVQIDFRVKPFYDLGEKFNGYEMWNDIGVIIRNCVKCVWIVVMLAAADTISKELLSKLKNGKAWLGYILAGAILMVYGAYDVFTSGIGFIPTYLAFYAVFTAMFYLTDKHAVKSYMLILLVYIF
ncbi:MAG: hypothetical protein IKD47_00475 [Clostridia bacterium]|nr:hypothetical protein [Clostridia bacterium]